MDEIRSIILSTAPRLVGLMDRTRQSRTYGCGDRYYWHYKLHDVANARFQEIGLFLALLYSFNFEGNVYFGKPNVREWVLASVKFWLKLVCREGHTSEVYPFERSYCATAFSSFAVSDSLRWLAQSDQASQHMVESLTKDPEFRDKINKAGRWLIGHCSYEVTNQVAAAALALSNLAQFDKTGTFEGASDDFIDTIIKDFKKNGFYTEYGGFDVGYTSIINSLLVLYPRKAKELRDIILESNDRIDRQTGNEGLYDPSATSRKTQFLYPYGFFATRSPVFEKILRGIRANAIITPLWMDDRYCAPLAIDYLRTYKAHCEGKEKLS